MYRWNTQSSSRRRELTGITSVVFIVPPKHPCRGPRPHCQAAAEHDLTSLRRHRQDRFVNFGVALAERKGLYSPPFAAGYVGVRRSSPISAAGGAFTHPADVSA